MVTELYERIQEGLEEKQKEVVEFLETAPEPEKELCLCDDEDGVEDHLHVIQDSLEKIEEQSFGVCVVCHGHVDGILLQMDYTASVCLDHYSDEERRRLEAELELSQIVQRALLPQQIPSIPGVELAAFSRPSEIIGGDYFDFFQYRDGTPGLVIADVSGHGVSAGILMSSLQTAIRTMAPDTDVPAEILERINRFYIHNIRFTTFVTVFLARYDPINRTLMYVNSGHNPPAVFRRSSAGIDWLTRTAPAIGLAEEYFPRTETVKLSSGDVLLLYTDGITEALNIDMEQFGAERLAQFIQNAADLTAADMLQVIRQSISAYSGDVPLADDLTLVALKVSG